MSAWLPKLCGTPPDRPKLATHPERRIVSCLTGGWEEARRAAGRTANGTRVLDSIHKPAREPEDADCRILPPASRAPPALCRPRPCTALLCQLPVHIPDSGLRLTAREDTQKVGPNRWPGRGPELRRQPRPGREESCQDSARCSAGLRETGQDSQFYHKREQEMGREHTHGGPCRAAAGGDCARLQGT